MPLVAGCSRQGLAQAATATATASASAAATPALATSPTFAPGTPQAGSTATPGGQPTPRPTPVGTPPADPLKTLNLSRFFFSPWMLVKRDALQLDGDQTDEMLFTIAAPADVVTQESDSLLLVLDYDPTYREWNEVWESDIISGTASPLPAANRLDGYNGGKLLGTNDPVFLLRTIRLDGHAHLYAWRWDAAKHAGERLKMASVGDSPERDADFEADLDVTIADLDNDGVYEVIADNAAGTQIWKWDGSKYAPEAKRP